MAIPSPSPQRVARPWFIRYFLFIPGSSTNMPQKPLGFTFEAFFTILIFIVSSYARLAAVCAREMSADSKVRL